MIKNVLCKKSILCFSEWMIALLFISFFSSIFIISIFLGLPFSFLVISGIGAAVGIFVSLFLIWKILPKGYIQKDESNEGKDCNSFDNYNYDEYLISEKLNYSGKPDCSEKSDYESKFKPRFFCDEILVNEKNALYGLDPTPNKK